MRLYRTLALSVLLGVASGFAVAQTTTYELEIVASTRMRTLGITETDYSRYFQETAPEYEIQSFVLDDDIATLTFKDGTSESFMIGRGSDGVYILHGKTPMFSIFMGETLVYVTIETRGLSSSYGFDPRQDTYVDIYTLNDVSFSRGDSDDDNEVGEIGRRLGPEPNRIPEESRWRVSSSTDPLTDETRTVLQVPARTGRGIYGDTIYLVLRKTGRRTEAYINWRSFLGLDSASVTYRVGDSAARTASLSISTDNRSTFFPPNHVDDLIASMFGAEAVVARVTPYSENPITATFPMIGLREIVLSTPHLSDWLPNSSEGTSDVSPGSGSDGNRP